MQTKLRKKYTISTVYIMTIILCQKFINQRTRSNGSLTFFSISKYGRRTSKLWCFFMLVGFLYNHKNVWNSMCDNCAAIIETMPNSTQKECKAWRTFFDLVKTRENSKWFSIWIQDVHSCRRDETTAAGEIAPSKIGDWSWLLKRHFSAHWV